MGKITVTKSSLYQEFDLENIFGIDLSSYPDIGLSFGQSVIDRIVERTKSGKDVNGKPFKNYPGSSGYSDDYVDSLEFKAFGKSRDNINMTLEGNMLADLDILDFSGNKIRVGLRDETEILKGFNHVTGDTVPRREFFGLTDGEIEDLRSEFSGDIQQLIESQDGLELLTLLGANGQPAAQSELSDLLNDDFFNDDGLF